tara:strand:+ start:858 stop:1157 length:300 start_codon:yes stop_codon:yes gene_type:complete
MFAAIPDWISPGGQIAALSEEACCGSPVALKPAEQLILQALSSTVAHDEQTEQHSAVATMLSLSSFSSLAPYTSASAGHSFHATGSGTSETLHVALTCS